VNKGKGYRKPKGEPALWDELKTRTTIALTPTAIAGLDTLANKWQLSRSEFIEHIGRGLIPIAEREREEISPD